MGKTEKKIIFETKIRIATLISIKEALKEYEVLTPKIEAIIDGKIMGNKQFIEVLENEKTFKVY